MPDCCGGWAVEQEWMKRAYSFQKGDSRTGRQNVTLEPQIPCFKQIKRYWVETCCNYLTSRTCINFRFRNKLPGGILQLLSLTTCMGICLHMLRPFSGQQWWVITIIDRTALTLKSGKEIIGLPLRPLLVSQFCCSNSSEGQFCGHLVPSLSGASRGGQSCVEGVRSCTYP